MVRIIDVTQGDKCRITRGRNSEIFLELTNRNGDLETFVKFDKILLKVHTDMVYALKLQKSAECSRGVFSATPLAQSRRRLKTKQDSEKVRIKVVAEFEMDKIFMGSFHIQARLVGYDSNANPIYGDHAPGDKLPEYKIIRSVLHKTDRS